MKRDLEHLTNTRYDVLVIGGGISGACIAWDAALRGLRVALVERGDFGGATSANSLKTVHGGLRYLQDASLRLIRKMIHERSAFLKIAPHMVHPLPFVMPSQKNKLMRHKFLLSVAIKLNDIISFDRNRGLDSIKALPNGRLLSRNDCLELLPDIDPAVITGGIIWYDAQVYNTERMLLSFLLSAVERGTDIANYVEVQGLLQEGRRVRGVQARDMLTGDALRIEADVVVNAAGGWIDTLLNTLRDVPKKPRFDLSIAVNLITRQIISDYGVAVQSNYTYTDSHGQQHHHSNQLILSPWRDYTMVGTFHASFDGNPNDYCPMDDEIQHYINEANSAYPGLNLTLKDITHVHWGFQPEEKSASGHVRTIREARLHDHKAEDDIDGLVSAVGVKWTTARKLAERTNNLVFKKLGRPAPPSQSDKVPVYGGDITHFDAYLQEKTQAAPHGLDADVIQHLIFNYGTKHTRILKYIEQDATWGERLTPTLNVLKAEVVHAVHEEMACKLVDVIMRRIELGSAGYPGDAVVNACAAIMAAELGWDDARTRQEIAAVRAVFGTRVPQADMAQ